LFVSFAMSLAETSARLREVLESAGFEDDLERDLLTALQKVVEKHAAKAEREAARAAAKAEREAVKAAAKAEREAARAAAKAEREAAKVLKKAVKTKLPDDELIPDSDMDGDAEYRRLTPPAFELVVGEDDAGDDELAGDDDEFDDDDEYRMWTEFQPRV
jgi:regulator of protease activity HflC (stomatin/prohibitin superfamily)